jgi:hypothetical protein
VADFMAARFWDLPPLPARADFFCGAASIVEATVKMDIAIVNMRFIALLLYHNFSKNPNDKRGCGERSQWDVPRAFDFAIREG